MHALLILNKTSFRGIHTSACIVIIFFIIKCLYHRHWILRENMFNYFCKGSIFRIIFTSIYFFNQRLKICINNWQGLSRFSILIKLQYLKSWENITAPQKSNTFLFTYFFYMIQVCFLSWENEDNSNNKNHQHFLMLFLLIILIIFFTVR